MLEQTQKKLGNYTLLEKIAQGGMAQVYKAKTFDAAGFERLVVIKRILPHISADPEYVEMLIDEAKIAVNFNHGNIAQIFDLGRVDEDYFIVMEYVDGRTFSQITKRLTEIGRKIPFDILLYCFIELCRGLSYIHNKKGADGKTMGVVHRDVSPQNIILSYAGNIKVIDFGVAKAKVKEGRTESGVLKGKFAYMSPEQARGDNIDSRSDIFSAGTLLWEMATGERLFKRSTNHETIQAIQKAKFDSAATRRPDVPKELDKIIRKALQKVPRSRYQDASEMAQDLEKLLFKINPDFKPVFAAEFIYKLFGPEEDEKELPDQLFSKEPTPVTPAPKSVKKKPDSAGVVFEEEESTIKESLDHTTPIVRFTAIRRVHLSYVWLIICFLLIFVLGSVYVYQVSKDKTGVLQLTGVDSTMTVLINDRKVFAVSDQMSLPAEQTHRIVVKKEQHKDFVRLVVLAPYEQKKLAVIMEKVTDQFGQLLIVTSPPGATIYLDNREWAERTPVTIKNLELGHTYEIGLFLEKYQFFHQAIKVVEAGEIKLKHSFQMNFAFLSVTSSPLGAEVFVDGKKVGETPFQSNNMLPKRNYVVLLHKEGYEDETMNITLVPGQDQTINFTLEPVLNMDEASVSGDGTADVLNIEEAGTR